MASWAGIHTHAICSEAQVYTVHQHNEFTAYSCVLICSYVIRGTRDILFAYRIVTNSHLRFQVKVLEDQVRSNCWHNDAHSSTQDNTAQVSSYTSVFWVDLFATQHTCLAAFLGTCPKAQLLYTCVGLRESKLRIILQDTKCYHIMEGTRTTLLEFTTYHGKYCPMFSR